MSDVSSAEIWLISTEIDREMSVVRDMCEDPDVSWERISYEASLNNQRLLNLSAQVPLIIEERRRALECGLMDLGQWCLKRAVPHVDPDLLDRLFSGVNALAGRAQQIAENPFDRGPNLVDPHVRHALFLIESAFNTPD